MQQNRNQYGFPYLLLVPASSSTGSTSESIDECFHSLHSAATSPSSIAAFTPKKGRRKWMNEQPAVPQCGEGTITHSIHDDIAQNTASFETPSVFIANSTTNRHRSKQNSNLHPTQPIKTKTSKSTPSIPQKIQIIIKQRD